MPKEYRDRFFLVKLAQDERKAKIALLVMAFLLLLLLGNTVYLTLNSVKQKSLVSSQVNSSNSTPSQKNISGMVTVTVVPSPTPSPLPPTAAPVAQGAAVKEIFIPFGSGTNQSSDWQNVPGLTAQIDFGKYQNIKEVHFEATVGIPTQNESASVQLFNVTDGHPVWYSPITLTDGQFVSSNPIIVDAGPKVYQVQMKTSLQFLANLYSARLHIILQ